MNKAAFSMPKHMVPSGEHVVSGKKNEILVAYLGTCVGVTLCDRRSGIGGLIHFLLPEPVNGENPWQPSIYAKTGLPMFIDALCAKGARKESLEACVAGGALIGPVCEGDLILDIGGRTSETVEKILRAERIPVRKSETGGYLGNRLSLDLSTWESEIEPLSAPCSASEGEEFKPPTAEFLYRAIDRVRPIPQVALKIIRMLSNDTCSVSEISKEITRDQVLSARVIKLCNSVFFSARENIDSIERAVMILGDKRLLRLTISASLEEFLTQSEQGYSLCKGGLFVHSVGTGIISQKLAEISGRSSPDLAYTAGLLHDIGKVVLDQYTAAAYPLFYRRIQLGGTSLIEIEREIFGVSHTDAGGRLARRWSLPESLSDVIAHHHTPDRADFEPELTHMISISDVIMSRFVTEHQLERANTSNLETSLRAIGFEAKQFPMLVEATSVGILNDPLLVVRH